MTLLATPRASQPPMTQHSSFTNYPVRKIAGSIGVLIVYVSIYWKDALVGYVPGVVTLVSLFLGAMLLALVTKVKISQFTAIIISISFVLLLITTLKSGSFSFSNYFLAPILAYLVVVSNRTLLLRLFIFHFILSLLVQAYEISIGEYLFFSLDENGLALDADLFSGANDVFRAKGLFQGPLGSVAFYILIGMVFRTPKYRLLCLLGAVMAQGRLGIMLIGLMNIQAIFEKFGRLGKMAAIIVSIFVIVSLFGYFLAALADSFFLMAFDLESSGNIARMYYWKANIELFLEYDMISILFGDLGLVNKLIGASESDFLRILLDCGLFGLLFYVFVLVTLYRAMRRNSEKYSNLEFAILVVAMAIFPFIQSLSSTLLFWVFYWVLMMPNEKPVWGKVLFRGVKRQNSQ